METQQKILRMKKEAPAPKTREISLQKIVGKGYAEFWNCKKRYRVVKGSRGSKKSKTAALWYIVHLMKYPQANLLVVRRTARTLKNSVWSDLQWAIDRLGVAKWWNGTSNPLEMTYLPTGQKILFYGLDSGLKITSISVPKGVLCWVYVEEAFEITSEDDFNKLDMSIRGEVPEGLFKQVSLVFNPWSSNTWIKRRFFDVEDENVLAMTTTYKCNEWLDEQDKTIFEQMKKNSPRRYRIEGEGEWGISEGLIYEKVEYKDFDIEEIRQIPGIKSTFSVDFGFTDPCVFICCMVDKSNKRIYVFDEWYKTGATNEQLAEQIKIMGYGSERVFCDAAEPKSIRELYDLGIRAYPCAKGKDSVNHGIQLIQNYAIVVSTRCPEFYKEITNYCWQKDKFDKPTDRPEHEFSHGMDAMRYGVTTVIQGDNFSFD